MQALDDFNPQVGVAEDLGHNIRRILAGNPSPMTYRGTNTYLIGSKDVAVIDPGPDDRSHLEAIQGALTPSQHITHIFVTHAHLDHSPLAAPLSRQTGAPVYGFGPPEAGRSAVMRELAAGGLMRGGEGVDTNFVPDVMLSDGETICSDTWSLTAHWTPGHFGNHLSFALEDVVFTGDLVMGWASSLVSPPDGDLTDFMTSCRKLKGLSASVFHSGHGAPITAPHDRLDWLIQHRLSREASILEALQAGPATAVELTQAIYTDTHDRLMPAAARNVLAHLVDLTGKNLVKPSGKLTADSRFILV